MVKGLRGSGVWVVVTTALWTAAATAAAAPIDVLSYPMGGSHPRVSDPVHGAAGSGIAGRAGHFVIFDVNANPGPAYPTAPVLAVDPVARRANAADAFAADEYFAFTLTVGSAVGEMSLTGLRLSAARGTGQFDRGFAVRVDTPTTADEWVCGSTSVPAVRNVFATFATDLSGVASLQHLRAGQSVTFEVAVFTDVAGVQTLDLDDLTVSADVVPEPGCTGVAVAAGLGLLAVRSRPARHRPTA